MNERNLFESIFTIEKGWDLTFIDGCYQNSNTNHAYAGWQASASREGYKIVPVDNGSSITRFSTQGIDVCSVSNTNP